MNVLNYIQRSLAARHFDWAHPRGRYGCEPWHGLLFQPNVGLEQEPSTVSDVTRILNAVQSGDSAKASELLILVYDELRQLAAARMSAEAPGQTLSTRLLWYMKRFCGWWGTSRSVTGKTAATFSRLRLRPCEGF